LDSGKVLLRQSAPYPYLAQALISPDGSTITAAVMYGPPNTNDRLPSHVEIVNISTATGTQLATPYRATVGEAVTMSSDGSGTYFLLAAGGGRSHGWVHDGQNHPIPPYSGDGQQMAW
jgi:hypothetical protein